MTEKGVILIVDDSPSALLLLTDILRAEKYDVRLADSGELALTAAATLKPDLILLDVCMPGMGGYEVCRRLKASADTRDLPVIFIGAGVDSDERLEAWRLGAVDFVSRPFDRTELIARVGTRLELNRLRLRLTDLVAERTASLEKANQQLREELAERMRAEHAARESEARFRTLADAASVAIWTSGPDSKIDFVNAYGLSFTGCSVDDLAGEGWKSIIHPADLESRYPAYAPLMEARRPYQAEYRVRRADGEYRWIVDTATPRFFADGAFAGYVGIAMDITDLKRKQEQLLAAQKFESVGVLAAGVAHRFNNLMGTIIAEADLAASELPPESEEHASIMRINATAIRASEIVSLLMAYSGAGTTGPPAPLGISQVIEEALILFKAMASKHVELSVQLEPKLPPVEADIAQIRQVVINLLTNAQEALQNRKGSVRLTTSAVTIRQEDAARHGLNGGGEYVRVEVTDSGCGIAEEARLRIFDPFYTTKALGRGLGLSAAEGIVRSLGGSIRARSAVGLGSTFEVLLPAFRYETGGESPTPALA